MTPETIYLLVQFKQTTEKVRYNHLFLCQTHRSGVEVLKIANKSGPVVPSDSSK